MPSCVVLVPANSEIERQCEDSLRELERRGYIVWRVPGFSQIDVARCQLATDALRAGFDETMWIDSDMDFDPDDVDRLRKHDLPISCGIYVKKGGGGLAVHTLPGQDEILFGREGGLVEILYAATGFLHVRREVYERVQVSCNLPVCNRRFAKPLVPFFEPLHLKDELSTSSHPEHWYLGEDFAFCERARVTGYKIMADTTIRLGHIGKYTYAWEDAGSQLDRYANFRFRATATSAPADRSPSDSGSQLSLESR